MLDIGWSELLLIGVVALIVVGPKDLPVMFRTLGRITAKARQMAREFSRAMEDAARESGVSSATDDLKSLTSKKSLGLDALERATERFEQWDPKFPTGRPADKPVAAKADANALVVDPGLDAAEAEFEPEPELPAVAPVKAASTPSVAPAVTPSAAAQADAASEVAAQPASVTKKDEA